MTQKKMTLTISLAFAFILTAAMLVIPANQAFCGEPVLEVSDCIKCHKIEPMTIEKANSKHTTKVTCLDCHKEHGPMGTERIPKCSMCHTEKKHYQLDNCLGCHSDPHKPLDLQLAENLTTPCLTCHEVQGQEFSQYASKHAEQACTFCHPTHGLLPDCSQCHEPHVEGQITINCLECHKPHHPKEIVPPATVPRTACGACHPEVAALMDQTTTKHKDFTCTFCHSQQHPFIPKCTDCHDKPPHSETMLKKFTGCIDCHLDPHNLVK